MVSAFIERHQEMIQGAISCFDRVVITGSLPDIGHAQAMEAYLRYHTRSSSRITRAGPADA